MIYRFQKSAYEDILKTLYAHQKFYDPELWVRPRHHKLIIGPTGSGKTFLAEEACRFLNWNFKTINATAWIISGAKGESTYEQITRWLAEVKNGQPVCIILDEIDKIYGDDCTWIRSLRAELYSLIDARILSCDIKIPESCDHELEEDVVDRIEKNLRRLVVIGCGAFQSIFDNKKTPMGFIQQQQLDKTDVSMESIKSQLQPELVNRFNSKIVILPELVSDDYKELAAEVVDALPLIVKSKVNSILDKEIEVAITSKSAARFPETLLTNAYANMLDTNDISAWEFDIS